MKGLMLVWFVMLLASCDKLPKISPKTAKEEALIDLACQQPTNSFCLDKNDTSWLAQEQRKMMYELSGGDNSKNLPNSIEIKTENFGNYVQIYGEAVSVGVESSRRSQVKIFDKQTQKEVPLNQILDKNKLEQLKSAMRMEFEKFLIENKDKGWWGMPQLDSERKAWLDKTIPYILENNIGRIKGDRLEFCNEQGGNQHITYGCITVLAKDYIPNFTQ